jgi:hypothetical protein
MSPDYAVVRVSARAGELHGHDPWFFRTLEAARRAAARCRHRHLGIMIFGLYADPSGGDALVLLDRYGTVLEGAAALN